MKSRLNRLHQKLLENGLDGVLISSPENRRYLSGFSGSAGHLLITRNAAILATDPRYTEQARLESPGFQVVRAVSGPGDWFPEAVSSLGIKRVGFEAQHLSYASYRQFLDSLGGDGRDAPSVELIPASFLDSLRAVKEAGELERIQKAIDIADAVFSEIAPTVEPGMTEREVAWRLERAMREMGAEGIPFEIIVASGPNAAFPHHRAGNRAIGRGEPVIIDMGAKVDGYSSDLSRTICLGQPDDVFKKVYNVVLKAQLAALSSIESGMTGDAADGLARKVIEEAGYGQAFAHGLGHGIGLANHEYPRLGRSSREVLEDGMVFTVEPGVYLPGWGGVRIEDVVMLVQGNVKVMSKAPKINPEV